MSTLDPDAATGIDGTGFDEATFVRVHGALRELAGSFSTKVVYANPVLLSPRWLAVLRARVAGESPEVDSILAQMDAAAETLRQQPWPLGLGPLDDLFVKVEQGEMTRKAALALAGGEDIVWRLSPFYTRRLCTVGEKWAREGDWRRGVLLAQLVLAALDARRGAIALDQAQMEFIATVYWLDIVTRAVALLPDGRLFRDAVARGERLGDVVVDPDGYFYPACIAHGLGLLHLDPYVGGRTNADYEGQLKAWRQRFREQLDAEGVAWDEATMAMPDPAQALPVAAHWLARAAAHRDGEQRGLSLKAYVQALVWQRLAGVTPPAGEVRRAGLEARQLLSSPEQIGQRAEIDNLMAWNDRLDQGDGGDKAGGATPLPGVASADDIPGLLRTPIEHWLDRMLPGEVIDTYQQAAGAIEARDPVTAFALWDAVQSPGWAQPEERRRQFAQRGLDLLAAAYQPGQPIGDVAQLAAGAEALLADQAPVTERGLRLLVLAYACGASNDEERGLAILDAARALDAGFASRYASLMDMLRAMLLVGVAVNHVDAKEPGEAVRSYVVAADAWLHCDCPARAWEMVQRAMDVADKGDLQALACFLGAIGELSPRIEQQVPGAAESLQVFHRKLMAGFVARGEARASLLIRLAVRAKGNAFTRALIAGTPLTWLASAAAGAMEAHVATLSRAAAATPLPTATGLDFELVLGAYCSPFEQAGGSTARQRLRNVMIGFDNAVGRAQMAHGAAPEWIATDESVKAALGPRSVLLILFIGQAPDGDLALFHMLLTNEVFEMRVGKEPGFPSSLLRMTVGDETVSATPFALSVGEMRRAIQAEPLTRKVDADAAMRLESTAANLLGGGLRERLDELSAAGKNHLCVWPHGPFHFVPFHLLGPEDAPLGSHWCITTLPSLQLLDPARRNALAPGTLQLFKAIGLDFPAGNARGLPPLAGAQAEARQVSEAMEAGEPLVGTAVTKAAVLDALRTHRRVHIATHGNLPVNAAAFQALYLGTGLDGDVLHAYEILRLDLRGIDLVTLSACETALGRLDVGDNLRGFAANLLVAGVSTIVGTLWPVETNCAKFFFTRLYLDLHAGATKGAAFRAAQLATRGRHPKHRDWGAFYLTGAIE